MGVHPQHFASIVTAPGSLEQTSGDVGQLSEIPVTLFVGEFDNWRENVRSTYRRLREAGVRASMVVLDGHGHELVGLFGGHELYDALEDARPRP